MLFHALQVSLVVKHLCTTGISPGMLACGWPVAAASLSLFLAFHLKLVLTCHSTNVCCCIALSLSVSCFTAGSRMSAASCGW
ncbi:hypothetical protein COO60DRAFT_110216 [Scenedesmus sp. NREL 46B-D3]|nr:hypothetical protein COO60DRAFT_110216 [Scenedesmus sp. NREL 46B-D3]